MNRIIHKKGKVFKKVKFNEKNYKMCVYHYFYKYA